MNESGSASTNQCGCAGSQTSTYVICNFIRPDLKKKHDEDVEFTMTANQKQKTPADPAGGGVLDQAPFSKGQDRSVGHDEVIQHLDIDKR